MEVLNDCTYKFAGNARLTGNLKDDVSDSASAVAVAKYFIHQVKIARDLYLLS